MKVRVEPTLEVAEHKSPVRASKVRAKNGGKQITFSQRVRLPANSKLTRRLKLALDVKALRVYRHSQSAVLFKTVDSIVEGLLAKIKLPGRGEVRNFSEPRERSGDHNVQVQPFQPLPPGNYTRENLPPRHPAVQAIIDDVDTLAAYMLAEHPIRPKAVMGTKPMIVLTGPTKRRV